jgi:Adenylate and Guanylate cyclase catalytic domain
MSTGASRGTGHRPGCSGSSFQLLDPLSLPAADSQPLPALKAYHSNRGWSLPFGSLLTGSATEGKRRLDDERGNTVNMASRMESHGVASTIQVTPATYERVRDRYCFEERCLANVKGRGR